jgi:hypothetical protein
MANLTEDIATYLITKGKATALGTDVFLDARPSSPDNIIVISEYAGEPSGIMDDLSRRIQVLVRNGSYESCRSNIWEIYNLLNNPDDRAITAGDRKGWFRALQSPFKLRTDENGRTLFVFNLEVVISVD